jgi:hypothetical protein
MFRENFSKFEAHVGPDVLAAAPGGGGGIAVLSAA